MTKMIKKFTISNVRKVTDEETGEVRTDVHDIHFEGEEDSDVSDGYHTFTELYAHRIELFISLCRAVVAIDDDPADPMLPVWRAQYHSDGTQYPNWFVLGIFKETGKQITYHLPIERWEDCGFAETLEKAPEYDGHTPADILERIKCL